MALEEARLEKATEDHNVIDDAIRDRGEGYTVFSIVSDSSTEPPTHLNSNVAARRSTLSTIRLKA